METIICDRSAFLYWRTPPIARLLASGPEDDSLLRHIMDYGELESLRAELRAASPPLARASGSDRRRTARLGGAGLSIGTSPALLATGYSDPVDVLVRDPDDRRPSGVVRPRVWSGELSAGVLERIGEGIDVASPVLAVQQMAARTTPVRVALMLSELMGGFSIYEPPEPLAAALQALADAKRLPEYCGWRAARDNGGKLTGLWTRPPLLSVAALREHLERATARGRANLAAGARLARVGAASPFEVQAGMLFASESRCGGEGYALLEHNRRVALSAAASRVCGQWSCYCDLFWGGADGGVDVECQSSSHHFGARSSAGDADRATALQMMGVEVIQLTYAQLANARRFEIFSRFLAEKIGITYHEKTEREQHAQRTLRAEVLVDWESLPNV